MKTYQILLLSTLLLLGISCKKSSDKKIVSDPSIEKYLKAGENYSFTYDIREKYLDSAYVELLDKPNDSITRFYLKRTTAAYYNMDSYDKAIVASKKNYQLVSEVNDTLGMGRALFFIGESFYGKSDNDSAFFYYTKAEKAYKNLKDTDGLGQIILYKSYVYYDVGEYILSESEGFKALTLLLNENRPTDIYNCYNLIATSLDGQDSNKEAIRYFELALKVLDNYKSEGYTDADIALIRASCYNNMGLVYGKMKNYRKAISIYEEAMGFEGVKNNSLLYAKLLNNLAYAKFKLGDNSNLPKMFYRSLKIRDSLDNKKGIIASNVNLGEYFLYTRDTARSINYLRTAYLQAKAVKSHFDILNSLKMLSDIDKRNKDYYKDRYITVSDSLQDIAKKTRNKFARIEYETDRLEIEKQALVKKNSFIIGVSAIVLLFIAAIFIIYYLNSRNKELLLLQEQQKANEEIYQLMFEQQNKIEVAKTEEKSRIAMELHDGILNNIYAVRLNLEFINKKADDESIARRKEYIKELQNIEAEIRGVSHDLSRNALFNQEQSFENMLKFMISSQKNNFDTEFSSEIDSSIDWENMSNVCKVNTYRIIQEALQNINKYSQAKEAKVQITSKEGNVSIAVTDDGIGFELEKAKGGIGLKNLRKRADALNGSLIISSKPGEGTTVEVLFPG